MAEEQDTKLSGERSPTRIRNDIERTRASLDVTLDALERRLSASHLVDRAVARLGAGARQGSGAAVEAVRENPVPALLLVAGLGSWAVAALRARGSAPPVTGSTAASGPLPYAVAPSARGRAVSAARESELLELGSRAKVAGIRARFWRLMDERPLVLGAAATAAGILAGIVVPKTRWERERIGPLRDAGLDRAAHAARESAAAAVEAARRLR